jgi:nucleoside-triphosphatase
VKNMIKNIKIGITGLPGAGKTHALHKVIEMLEAEDKVIGGMITDPIIENEQRNGFKVMNWVTKEEKVFAHKELDSEVMVGKYGVDIEALESIGVPAIRNATEEAELIIIDEVGKMEVESPLFIDAVKDALDTDKPLILTLHKKSRNPLLQDIRRRDDVRILEVTPINRDLLPHKIIRLLKGEGELE